MTEFLVNEPKHVLWWMFEFMEAKDLVVLSRVSTRFKELIYDVRHWFGRTIKVRPRKHVSKHMRNSQLRSIMVKANVKFDLVKLNDNNELLASLFPLKLSINDENVRGYLCNRCRNWQGKKCPDCKRRKCVCEDFLFECLYCNVIASIVGRKKPHYDIINQPKLERFDLDDVVIS